MVATSDASYPAQLQREDQRRGQQDGEQRIPSLTEVRDRQRELRETGGQLTVGYQVVLLAELSGKLKELELATRQSGRAALLDFSEYDTRIDQAAKDVGRMADRLRAAEAALTTEELLPRNPEEERRDERTLRNRREVGRARRIARAREIVEQAHDLVEQWRGERAAAVRQYQQTVAESADRARELIELYQRRLAEYVSALALHHPDGRTLYPLLSVPEIQLPAWITETPPTPSDTRSPT